MSSSEVLREACSAAGFDARGAEPRRLAENETWSLASGIIVRISMAGQGTVAAREVQVARWLAEQGVRAVAPLAMDQPVVVASRPVTFWVEVPNHQHGTVSEVAAVLRTLHSLPRPDHLDVGRLDPFVRLRDRITAAVTLSSSDRRWLVDVHDDLVQQWNGGFGSGRPECFIHGDAWPGNIVSTSEGPLVMDLERASVGPPEWDLVSTAVRCRTTGAISPDDYESFCETYGYDVTLWDGYSVLAAIRELRITSYAAQHASTYPSWRREAQVRVDCLRGRRGPRPWNWKGIL
ncbi:phosphotransferase family protein [Kitasatospora viridis]|uniref:Thiamine kinase-like enzyme n=1 Tax=Kitasatospora viridis TaxID=281105 RepID=A0A561SAB9_9ACTN|nr:aminoglycoside phosphotransferase family protein [Kitasatospora viridis]TWF71820.1 thiamine kinase-like enzyme [Kitasatospora viridis]